MDKGSATLGTVLVDELKRQARDEGYYVVTVSRAEVGLYAVYALGVLLGWLLARRLE